MTDSTTCAHCEITLTDASTHYSDAGDKLCRECYKTDFSSGLDTEEGQLAANVRNKVGGIVAGLLGVVLIAGSVFLLSIGRLLTAGFCLFSSFGAFKAAKTQFERKF